MSQITTFRIEIACIKAGRPIHEDSPLAKVTPYLDIDGVLRVGGRLTNAPLQHCTKHPIILPRLSHLTRLIILQVHDQWWCSAAERTLAQFRQSYWAPGGRSAVRSALFHCKKCRNRNFKPQIPLMAALPADRVVPSQPAFTITGIDFCGPLAVIIHRRTHKGYGCLFTCMSDIAGCPHRNLSVVGYVIVPHGISAICKPKGVPQHMLLRQRYEPRSRRAGDEGSHINMEQRIGSRIHVPEGDKLEVFAPGSSTLWRFLGAVDKIC